MKILITTDVYEGSINGVVTSLMNLANGLKEEGHDVRILTLSNSFRSYKKDNVYYLGSFSAEKIYTGIRILMSTGNGIVDELVEWKPDVVHSQCEFSTFIFAKIISKRCHAPLIHTYHTVYESFAKSFCPVGDLGVDIIKLFSRVIVNKTDAVIVPTDKIATMLKDYGVKVPMHTIPTGIELGEYTKRDETKRQETRHKLGIADDECVLTFVGRVSKEKNIDEIVDFMSDSRTKNVRFLVVGDGPYRCEIEKLAKEKGVYDRMIFAGMVDHSEIADYYRAGDIFVSGSTNETQGLTYMEAMAAGLTLLCRDDEALNAVVVNGKNGFTYKDKEEFVAALDKVIDNRELRQSIGNKAMKTVLDKYSVKTFAGKCRRTYAKYMSKHAYETPVQRFRRKLEVLLTQ